MPLYDCGSVEIVPSGEEVTSIEVSDPYQTGNALYFTMVVSNTLSDYSEVELDAEISDRDNVAVRGSGSFSFTNRGPGDIVFRDSIRIDERPTAQPRDSDGKIPAELNVEATGGGVTVSDSIDIAITPSQGITGVSIISALQDGGKARIQYQMDSESPDYIIGEEEIDVYAEIVPLVAGGLLPSTNVGSTQTTSSLTGVFDEFFEEIPIEYFLGDGFEGRIDLRVEGDTIGTHTDSVAITVTDPGWIGQVDADCTLTPSQVAPGEQATLDVTLTNNAGPSLGGTVQMNLVVEVLVDGVKGDDSPVTVRNAATGDEGDSSVLTDVRGPRGVGSDEGGDTVTTSFNITTEQEGSYDIEVDYRIEDGTATRIIPTDEIL